VTALAGYLALLLALTGAGVAAAAAVAGLLRGGHAWPRPARIGWTIASAGIGGAALALIVALARGDSDLAYVARHSEPGLDWHLRLAASWAGQEGALLLWVTLLALVGACTIRSDKTDQVPQANPAGLMTLIAIFSSLILFFAALILLGANPFVAAPRGESWTGGLHPQLQHWAMLIHPPLLILGYAASAAPFALILSGVADGSCDAARAALARRWAMFAWLALGSGIVLGMRWAYVEQGWGGYWSWDPVENASLLPWLTGTALIHALAVQQHRGNMNGWSLALACATFVLSFLGAWVTRSGSISSVHSFARPELGAWFLGLAALLVALTAGVARRRRSVLPPAPSVPAATGRESWVFGGILLLLAAAISIGAGTALPILAGAEQGLGVGARFYTKAVGPIAIGILIMTALSPLLRYGGPTKTSLAKAALGPVAFGLVAAGLAMLLLPPHPALFTCVALLGACAAATVSDLVKVARALALATGFSTAVSLARVLGGNQRRYGGQLAHAGLLIMILGITGSSLFATATTATLRRGESISVSGHSARFDGVQRARGGNYIAARATFAAANGAVISAERRYYDRRPEQPVSEVALRGGWRADLMLVLLDWSEGGEVATVQARVVPFMRWIWVGASLVGVGGCVCLLPRILRAPRRVRTRRPHAGQQSAAAAVGVTA
jgi:cytochrome c-type biogenesis protein CcmF